MTEKTTREICLEYIKLNPGATTSDVAAEIRKTRSTRNDTINITLSRLRAEGLIDRINVEGVLRNFYRGTRFGADPRINRFDQLQAAARANHG